MKVQAYLERIGLTNAGRDADTLVQLQQAHYRAVPYENLDIINGKPLDLNPKALYRKIVEEGRGGYCFELNGLYAWLLKELGFKITERLGRFLKDEKEIPMGRHRILLVELEEGTYVCDVGIGCPAPTRPLMLKYDSVQQADGTDYRFVKDAALGNVLQYLHHGQWEPYFSFGNEENYPCDFIAPSFFCEKSPDSVFNKGMMLHIFEKEGRTSLDGTKLKRFRSSGVELVELESPQQVFNTLRDCFGIVVRQY